jgi:hypothetical protein
MRSFPDSSPVSVSSKLRWRLVTSLRVFSVLLTMSLVTLGLTASTPASAGTVVTWSTPTEIVGTAGTGGIGDNGNVQVEALSCSSDGNCAAGGYYYDGDDQQAFVVNEVSGTWGTPIELGAAGGADGFLGDNGNAEVISISCPSDGNCSAGGYYSSSETTQAFVVNEVSGTWGSPIELVAVGGADGFLGDGDTAQVTSLSCSSAGNCSAGGFLDNPGEQAFVVSEVSGTWGTPIELGAIGGGDGFLGDLDFAYLASVSCPSDGNCSAGGTYYDGTNEQAFVIDEVSGVWGTPANVIGLSGTGALGDSAYAELAVISCTSAGNCSAAGRYSDDEETQAFVVNEIGGTWGTPTEISGLNGTGGLGDDGVNAQSQAISCSSDGYCAVGGIYDVDDGDEAFLAHATTVTTLPPPPPTTSTTTTTTTTTVPPTTTTTTPPVTTTTVYKHPVATTTVPTPKGPGTGAGGTASPTHSGDLLVFGGLLALLGLASIGEWLRRRVKA